jgi:hypothetical protein
MKKHTETTTEHKYECAPCGLTFRCKSNLKVHINSQKHKKRIIDACPDAVITTETKHNDIIIKTKKRIDPNKSHIYLKKVNVTKPKKQNNLVELFIKYCSGKIDLNDFYDFDFYRDEPEPDAEYNDILDVLNDDDFKLF